MTPMPDGPTPSANVDRVRPSVVVGGLAGAVAAGAALAAGEIVSAIVGATSSPVTAVGGEFVDRFAARLKEFAVSVFGTNDKPALVVGIVISSIVLGALLGIAARRTVAIAYVGFGLFGAFGLWAMATDPQVSSGEAVVTSLASVAAGIGAFMALWHFALPRVDTVTDSGRTAQSVWEPSTPVSTAKVRQTFVDRRGFLAAMGGLVVVAGSATALSRRVRASDSVNSARRSTVLPRPKKSVLPPDSQPFEIDGLTPYVTENADFYRIDTALLTPQIGASGWRLSIKGMVDEPFELTYDELLAMDSVEETVTIQCVSNEINGHLVGNAVWQGVPLTALLERAGVQSDATQIVGRSDDGFTAGFPTSAALDGRTALVAYAMNGEPLPADHGYPARLIVAGLYGYVSATKWLTSIELTTWEALDGYWISRGWSKDGPIKTATRIDVPRKDVDLAAGSQPIAGVSWAPDRGITKVEVQIDGGEWHECELGDVANDDTWVQWHYDWDAKPGDHTILARATDATGEVQTDETAAPIPNGASGYPTRRATVR